MHLEALEASAFRSIVHWKHFQKLKPKAVLQRVSQYVSISVASRYVFRALKSHILPQLTAK